MKIRPVLAEFFHAEGQKDRRTDGASKRRGGIILKEVLKE